MKEHALYDIEYLPLRISLVSLKRAELPPYLGSTLRGVIGQSLYRTDKEAYDFIYVNGKKSEGEQDIIKPYGVIPPEICGLKKVIEQGEELIFEFVLFGNAVKYTSSLVIALQNIHHFGIGFQRYPFCLSHIINRQNQRILWWKEKNHNIGMNAVKVPCHGLSEVTGVVIRLCTPLRIRRNGQLLTSILFPTLIRNIIKRMEAMSERYGGWVNKEEAERIYLLAEKVKMTDEKLRIKHLERYSNRVKKKMDISGLLGELHFEGDLTPFVPWLLAAQELHIGRNTTFGMGRIAVYFR